MREYLLSSCDLSLDLFESGDGSGSGEGMEVNFGHMGRGWYRMSVAFAASRASAAVIGRAVIEQIWFSRVIKSALVGECL
jgi:hypothetical protein